MSEYTLTQKELTQMKAQLTRAKNRGPAAVIATCNTTLARFETTGYPDCWMNWQRAKEDAEQDLARRRAKQS